MIIQMSVTSRHRHRTSSKIQMLYTIGPFGAKIIRKQKQRCVPHQKSYLDRTSLSRKVSKSDLTILFEFAGVWKITHSFVFKNILKQKFSVCFSSLLGFLKTTIFFQEYWKKGKNETDGLETQLFDLQYQYSLMPADRFWFPFLLMVVNSLTLSNYGTKH